MAKIDLFWYILAYFGRIPTVKIKLRGACFNLCFCSPEFLEKYFQPKRGQNSPAPVKKSKKSRPRGTPLIAYLSSYMSMAFAGKNNNFEGADPLDLHPRFCYVTKVSVPCKLIDRCNYPNSGRHNRYSVVLD